MPKHEYRMARLGWTEHLGRTETLRTIEILGRSPVRVQEELVDVFTAFDQVLKVTGYENPCDYIGSYFYRTIGKKPIDDPNATWSTHAYGTAIDHDYGYATADREVDKNPYIRRPIVPGDDGFGVEWQILEHQVRAIEAIKNHRGDSILLWLGWGIGDTMHWQVNVRPENTAVDWSTVMEDEGMCPWNVCRDEHFFPELSWAPDMPTGTGEGENQGMCFVPPAQEQYIKNEFDNRVYHAGNKYRYDYTEPLSTGRWSVLRQR